MKTERRSCVVGVLAGVVGMHRFPADSWIPGL